MKNKANISLERKIISVIIIFILTLFSITSFYLILSHAFGYYQEGIIGYVCDFIFRIFIIIIISIVLIGWYFVKERKIAIIFWWICVLSALVGFFYLLKAPIDFSIY